MEKLTERKMRIALYGRALSEEYDHWMCQVLDLLHKDGVEILIYETLYESVKHCFHHFNPSKILMQNELMEEKSDILFSLGGDGTVLDTVPLIRHSGIPVLGINTGRLGFLSSVAIHESIDAIHNILHDNYEIENRSMIQMIGNEDIFDGFNYALNEISILHSDVDRMIEIHVFVDDKLLNTYWADGLLLSTPTGSTGYSLSAGGPIVSPDTPTFVITPIAAHNLTLRPLIISDKSHIRIKVTGRCDNFALGLDSRIKQINKEIELHFKRADFGFNMIKMPDKDFFSAIRKKLLWGQDIRN